MRLFHLSVRPLLDLFVRPRVPKRDFAMEGEECRTPRFCMAESVLGCVRALGYSDPGCIGTKFRIYEPADPIRLFGMGFVSRPNRSEVPDSSVTGEIWITAPFWLRETGLAEITGYSDGTGRPENRYFIENDPMFVDDFRIDVRGEFT